MNATRLTQRTWIGLGVAMGGALLLVVVFRAGHFRPRPPEGAPSASVLPASSVAEPAATAPAREPPPSRQAAVVVPRAPEPVTANSATGTPAAPTVRVRADQPLATVNGVAITLKDLVALPQEQAGGEQIMSVERYGFLLDRAIQREVAYQTAQAQGVALSEAQRQRLAALRARSEAPQPGVFDTVQQNPANAEFAQRDAAALLLQATLAEKAGVPSPHVTAAQVQAYYQQHQAEFDALPIAAAERAAAWEKIDQAVRLKLAPQIQAEHQARFQHFLEQLLAAAQINRPAS